MIDYIKLEGITRESDRIAETLPKKTVSDDDDSVQYESAKVAGAEVVRLSGDIINISGSLLHKAFNKRKTGVYENVTPVTFFDLQEQLDILVEKYSLDEENTRIKTIEFSANCHTSWHRPSEILQRILGLQGGNSKLYSLNSTFHNNRHFKLSHKPKGYEFITYDKDADTKLKKVLKACPDKSLAKSIQEAANSRLRFELRSSYKSNVPFSSFPKTIACLRKKDCHRNALLLLRSYIDKLCFVDNYVNLVQKFNLERPVHSADQRGAQLVTYLLLAKSLVSGQDLMLLKDELISDINDHPISAGVRKSALRSWNDILDRYRSSTLGIATNDKIDILINFDKEMAYYLQEDIEHPGWVGEFIKAVDNA